MTGPGGTEADRAARERLAREARETATALLDWVGTRVDGVATARADGASGRPRQSPGPCTWCPVCALVAALRGEQPELTATLAEQASGLLVILRLLVQAHATGAHEHAPHGYAPHEHPAHGYATHPAPEPPPAAQPGAGAAPAGGAAPSGDAMAEDPASGDASSEVPWDVAPHALFDPEPRPTPAYPGPDDSPRSAPERPTGKRGPRPSPRRQTAGESDGPAAAAAEPRPFPQPAPQPQPAPAAPTAPAASSTAAPSSPAGPAPAAPVTTPTTDRSGRGVQRIPVRRRTRPC
ncbi:hypothetical protein LQ327_24250 [Actinomycetospora endophytica]|uniref:Uncharacterized protein n=1 Tax=Actinomycetospora endophytica TaxID=2291215 RepID=A0ABS8PG54_9PSEU|nr:hypothetical protein [Actinomycetospora endophytica]MCD2196490.1 hypothetical protein [Actinomycetospora endophytica]